MNNKARFITLTNDNMKYSYNTTKCKVKEMEIIRIRNGKAK